jgi:5'-3' exonuclease
VGAARGPGWRRRYHEHVFGHHSPDGARGIALAYVLSLAWSAAYMRQRCLSRGLHYPHGHAPTALDLCQALQGRPPLALAEAAERAFADADRAHSAGTGLVDEATWQLMLVLPPQSAHLIEHPGARRVVAGASPSGSAAHMYPRAFRMSTYGRERLHECAPMLPGLDAGLLALALLEAT